MLSRTSAMDEEVKTRMDALAAAFRSADERMRGLPIHNPALDVGIVEARPWREFHAAILITPWSMNLVLLPRERPAAVVPAGTKREIELPCGMCTFLAGDASLSETHWSCSLFSPVLDFPDQDTARAVARRIMADLFSPPQARAAEESGGRQVTRRELIRGGGRQPT